VLHKGSACTVCLRGAPPAQLLRKLLKRRGAALVLLAAQGRHLSLKECTGRPRNSLVARKGEGVGG